MCGSCSNRTAVPQTHPETETFKCFSKGTKKLHYKCSLDDVFRQPFSMSNASRMLQILDLFSLACLALIRAVRYEPVGIKQPKS